jgi:hypothetical protein
MREQDLRHQLRAWTDAVAPVTIAEVRRRSRRGVSPRQARTLTLVAAALLVLAAIAGVVRVREHGGLWVRTTDEPTAPSGSVSTTTTSSPTKAKLPASAATPRRFIAIDADHRLALRESATGEIVRALVNFDDPAKFGGGGQDPVAAGSFGGRVAISPDQQTVYYDTCCEPAPGVVYRAPIDGGDPEQVTFGSDPAISSDGTKLVVVDQQSLKVIDLVTGRSISFPHADNDPIVALRHPVWSPDDSSIAIEEYDQDSRHGDLKLMSFDHGAVDFDGGHDLLQAAYTVAKADPRGTPTLPVFLDGDRIAFVRQAVDGTDASGPVTIQMVRDGTKAGDGSFTVVASRQLDGPVRSMSRSASGAVLVVLGDGSAVAMSQPFEILPQDSRGGGMDAPLPGTGYQTAAW